jgi:hypothetical protein
MIDPGLDLFGHTGWGDLAGLACQAREMAETAGPWASVVVGLDRLPLSSCSGLDIFFFCSSDGAAKFRANHRQSSASCSKTLHEMQFVSSRGIAIG